jgi:type I restriction enzyme S subunit
MKLDVTANDYKTIKLLLNAYLPNTGVWAYGSRMKFTSKPESDLDLVAFIEPEQEDELAKLKNAFAESDLPFKVDILDWGTIPDNFKKNIEGGYVVINDIDLETELPPVDWKTYNLGEISTDISYGYTESASWIEVGPKFLRITDIQNYFVDWKSVPYCFITDANHSKYKLELGDIVIARTGATTGITNIFKDAEVSAVFASYLIRYRINKTFANPFYISYILKSPLWKSHVGSIIGGSAQPGANAKQFANFRFILPPIVVQNALSDILESLDEKIELNRQMNQTLETIAHTIFKEWFVNFNFPGFDGELEDGLPNGWRWTILDDIVNVQGGTTPSTIISDYWDGEYHWTTPKDLSNIDSPVLLDTERKLTKAGINQIGSRILPKGTLLLSSRAPIGYLAISNIPVSINQGYIAIQGKQVSNLFMLFWLKLNMGAVKSRANGSTFQEISKSSFKEISIVLPDDVVLKSFDNIVTPIFKKIVSNEVENKMLIQIRDGLLPKLMSGKIEIIA